MSHRVTVTIRGIHVPPLQRQYDKYIIDEILTMYLKNKTILQAVNKCRLYLQVYTLSDILTATGDCFRDECWKVTQRIPSTYLWPNVCRPSVIERRAWRKALRYTFMIPEGLIQPLGDWYNVPRHQQSRCNWHHAINTITVQTLSGYRIYTPTSRHAYKESKKPTVLPYNHCIPIQVKHNRRTLRINKTKLIAPDPTPRINYSAVCGHTNLNKHSIIQLVNGFKDGTICGACDGSEKNGEATYGYVLCNRSLDIQVSGRNKCPSIADPSSLYAELCGVLGIVHTLNEIYRQGAQDMETFETVHIYIDNLEVVNRLDNPNKVSSKMSQFPLTVEVLQSQKPQIPIKWHWIRSHTDEVGFEYQLNAMADDEATLAHRDSTPVPEWPMWTYGPYICRIHNIRKGNLLQADDDAMCETTAFKKFMQNKWKWSLITWNSIDWKSFSKAIESMPHYQRLFWVKLSSGWLPTSQRRAMITSQSDQCQSCGQCIEHQRHVFQCEQNHPLDIRETIKNAMKKIHTSTRIIDAFTTLLLYPDTNPQHFNSDQDIMNTVYAQKIIGYHAMWHGKLSRQWQILQDNYMSRQAHPYSTAAWSTNIIKMCATISHQVWVQRNTFHHELTNQASPTEINLLNTKILSIFDNPPPVLPNDKVILRKSIDAVMKYSSLGKTKWLKSVENAVANYFQYLPKTWASQTRITEWLFQETE